MLAVKMKQSALAAVTLATIILLVLSLCSTASIAVKTGDRIQSAINSARPGETIEIYSGTYKESVVIDRQLYLRGIDSGKGIPVIETNDGSAITIKASGVIVEGLRAKSASGWTEDAGILATSSDNIIRKNTLSGSGNAGMIFDGGGNNTISGNVVERNGKEGLSLRNSHDNLIDGNLIEINRYGLKLSKSEGNEIVANTFLSNRYEAIYIENSTGNTIEENYARDNLGGLTMDTSRDNVVRRNDFVGNENGIHLSYHDSEDVKTKGKGVIISYSSMPSEETVSSNNTIYLNNLSNSENAYDDGLDYWDNGKVGNNYSDFNTLEDGCTGTKICDSEHRIQGGPSVDQYPQVMLGQKIRGLSSSTTGALLRLFRSSFIPGGKMRVNFTAPTDRDSWVSMIAAGNQILDDWHLGQNTSGDAVIAAPKAEGAYQLRMHDKNDAELVSIPFNVTIPGIIASPLEVSTCEKIAVAFWGASGQKNDWIGMFQNGSSEAASKQILNGNENGNVTFRSSNGGSFEFIMFNSGTSTPVAKSNSVQVDAREWVKVIAEPARVPPGGTVTVTYWGAPSSGTGIIGMYGVNRPDKFSLEKRGLGAQSCGVMTWRLPSKAGQYDFRMFYSDITSYNQGAYQLLAQSNVVTVA
jgi:nitrous oxidase accessory protein